MKCPYLGRKVSSYRFCGFQCSAQLPNQVMGFIQEWSKEQRDKKMNEYGCLTDNSKCYIIQAQKEGKR